MVVGHTMKSGSKKGYSSKRNSRYEENKLSVNVTRLPVSSSSEFNIGNELEASGRRIDLDQAKEDENHNQEVLSHKKYITGEEGVYNDEELDRESEPDEEVIVGTSMDDYESHLHPVTRSIFQQLSTSNVENVEEVMNSNHVQLYMPNAIRSCRMRRINYSPWGYGAPAHGDIINISQGIENSSLF
jgi:hypothetical protein